MPVWPGLRSYREPFGRAVVGRAVSRSAPIDSVEPALAGGAPGLSSGLNYMPSRFATAGEAPALAAPLAQRARYSAKMR